MRIIVAFLIPTAILAYILGLIDPGLWAKVGLNISRFIPLLGVRNDLWGDALTAVYETLIISVFGVSSGVLIAYLLAPLASPLLAPRTIAIAGRILANSARTVPAILWAILFVILVGPGAKAGALALAIYTSTYLAKFFYEALESVDRELLDSLKAMGLRGYTLAFALYTHIRRQIISSVSSCLSITSKQQPY
jgi:ABC-type phosphate/phosphonate transport system permease subunit